MWIIIGIATAVLVVFIYWRGTSVERGARKRDNRIFDLIEPIGLKLERKEAVSVSDVAPLACRPENRFQLFSVLRTMDRSDLIPDEFLNEEKEAEAELAYWLMHPNEMGDPPEIIELLEKAREMIHGREVRFYVFRFRMPSGNFAAADGWLMGVTGPHFDQDEFYQSFSGAFSRAGDKADGIQISELLQWYKKNIVGIDE